MSTLFADPVITTSLGTAAAFAAGNSLIGGQGEMLSSDNLKDAAVAGASSYAAAKATPMVSSWLQNTTVANMGPQLKSVLAGLIYAFGSGYIGNDNRSFMTKFLYGGASDYAAGMVLGAGSVNR